MGLSPALPRAADAKYPDWKGAWGAVVPARMPSLTPGNGIYTAGGQPSFDQTKALGTWTRKRRSLPSIEKVFEESLADQGQRAGEGNFFLIMAFAACLEACR